MPNRIDPHQLHHGPYKPAALPSVGLARPVPASYNDPRILQLLLALEGTMLHLWTVRVGKATACLVLFTVGLLALLTGVDARRGPARR